MSSALDEVLVLLEINSGGAMHERVNAAMRELAELRRCAEEIERLRGTALREPRCQCQWEAGDSPCRVHGDE